MRVSDKCAEIGNIVLNAGAKNVVTEESKESKTEDKVIRHDPTEESNDDIEANKKHKITWVGTSLSKPLDKKKFEHDAEVNLTVKKAYCIRAEGRFKEANFTAIVPELVKKGGIDSMVLHLHRVY